MKGFAPFTIAIVGIIMSFTMYLSAIIPFLTLRYHLAIDLKETYEYNNAELALLSLVSKKHTDTSIYRVLSERSANGFDENMQKSVKEKLNLMLNSTCFELVNASATILRPDSCEPAENTGEIPIFLPYNQKNLVEKIILVYS